MLQNIFLSSIYSLFLLLNSVLLLVAGLKSYKAISGLNITAFNHFVRSWVGLAFFWFGFFLIELSTPLYELNTFLLFNYIVIFIAPFMIEIFNFYLSLFSNRLNQFETYFPILIGITWGLAIGGVITNQETLLLIPLVLVLIISLFFMIYCVIILLRLEKVKQSFSESNAAETKFLQSLKLIVIFTIIGGSYDAIWLPLAFISTEYFYIVSTIGFGIIALFTLIFLSKVNELLKVIPNVDLSIIINELN